MKTIRIGIMLVLFLSLAFVIQAGAVLAENNSGELDQIDIDKDGEMEIIIKDPSRVPDESYTIDLDSDGDIDIVVVGTKENPPKKK
jgi:hypothetical protein